VCEEAHIPHVNEQKRAKACKSVTFPTNGVIPGFDQECQDCSGP